jgi:hypothetical protein
VPLGLVERGKDLSNLISGSHALYFNLFDAANDEHEDAAATFKELITEWLDIFTTNFLPRSSAIATDRYRAKLTVCARWASP